jgi:hypothetical protein
MGLYPNNIGGFGATDVAEGLQIDVVQIIARESQLVVPIQKPGGEFLSNNFCCLFGGCSCSFGVWWGEGRDVVFFFLRLRDLYRWVRAHLAGNESQVVSLDCSFIVIATVRRPLWQPAGLP